MAIYRKCLKAFSMSSLLLLFLSGPGISAPPTNETDQGKQKKKQETLDDYYRHWLEKDVVYIITPEEKAVFEKLQTDEEREQFVMQFWKRRDPDPTTPENEYKEEHYRRIQYANDVFAAGIPGWMTDRGRIYIKFGKPDRIETHPAGGPYQRRQEEGGGETSTYPFERWEYHHIEGIGDDVELEFVDYSGGNLYKLAKSPNDKDELLYVPWAGQTDAEADPASTLDPGDLRWRRIAGIRDYGIADTMGVTGERAKYTPFARSELAANFDKAPAIHFKDLRARVSTRVTFNVVPFHAYTYFLKLTSRYALAPLTLQIPNSNVAFEVSDDGVHSSRLQVYGRVEGLLGNTVFEFDDEIVNRFTKEQFDAQRYSSSFYHRLLRLPPGRYKLTVLLKDAIADRMGTVEQGISVPAFPNDKLAVSPVIEVSELLPISDEEMQRDAYAFGRFRIRPRLDQTFHKGEYLGIYFEVYNAAIDPSKGAPAVKVEYQIQSKGEAVTPFRDISLSAVPERDLIAMPIFVDIASQPAGSYQIVFRITDAVAGTTVQTRGNFKIAG